MADRFVFPTLYNTTFGMLTDEQAGKVIKKCFAFLDGDDSDHEDQIVNIVFTMLRYEQPKPHSNKGERHWNYKGGVSSENHSIRNSAAIREWRSKVFERDDYTCQHCKVRGGTLHAHHIKPFSKHRELRTVLSNGLTLCKSCHNKVHSKNP